MKQVLWINSCMRGAGQSRTLELCRTFLEELRVRRPGLKVAERDLTRAELPVMTAELSRRREELAAEGREDPLLLPAREMARADLVLTKPGGITLFETIFSELPILAWEPFLEQEKNNARFLVKRGLGRVAAKEPEECLSAIRALIYDDETLEWMAGNMRAMKGQLEEESLNRMLAGLEAEKGVRVG